MEVQMHTSLVGFVAGPNGEKNWTNKNYECLES